MYTLMRLVMTALGPTTAGRAYAGVQEPPDPQPVAPGGMHHWPPLQFRWLAR